MFSTAGEVKGFILTVIACGLGNIQKVRDGDPLGGRSNAADDFATLDDEEFLA